MPNKNTPTIVVLSKVKQKKDSSICEFLTGIADPEIPRSLIDAIFVTLESGEKYKVEPHAIQVDFKLEEAVNQLAAIGIPRDIATIEIVIDTDAAEKVINVKTARLLDSIFSD